MERVEAPMYYLANPPKGARNVFIDPYSATAFVVALKVWLVATFPKRGIIKLVTCMSLGMSPADIAQQLSKSRHWVRLRQDELQTSYETEGGR